MYKAYLILNYYMQPGIYVVIGTSTNRDRGKNVIDFSVKYYLRKNFLRKMKVNDTCIPQINNGLIFTPNEIGSTNSVSMLHNVVKNSSKSQLDSCNCPHDYVFNPSAFFSFVFAHKKSR